MENKIYIDAEKVLEKYPPIIELGTLYPLPDNERQKIILNVKKSFGKNHLVVIHSADKNFVKIHTIFKSEKDYIKAEKLLKKYLKEQVKKEKL